jgi:hypothetical protein
MFVVSEAEAAAIRAVFRESGEFAAAIELRRRFPGIGDNAQARECARTVASWKPLRPMKRFASGVLSPADSHAKPGPETSRILV